MKEFFATQMDFIFFIHGMSFILTALCAFLNYRQEKRLFWIWTTLFALSHGISEWLNMFVFGLGDGPMFNVMRTTFGLASFLFLLEGARSISLERHRKVPGWLAPAVGTFAFLAGWMLEGLAGADFLFRVSLVIGGGIWVSVLVVEHLRTKWFQEQSPTVLTGFGLVTLLYVCTQIVAEGANFPLANILTYSNFFKFCGFSIQAIRAALAFGAAVTLWAYYMEVRRKVFSEISLVSHRLYARWAVVVLGIVFFFGWIGADLAGRYVQGEKGDVLQKVADNLATNLDWHKVARLTGTPADIKGEEYNSLKDFLQKINDSMPRISYVYLMGRRDGKVIFYVDTTKAVKTGQAKNEEASPGQIYNEVTGPMVRAFKGESVLDGPAMDEWGTLMSGLSPVFNRDTGDVLAIVGVDMRVNDWNADIYFARLMVIAIVFVLVLSILAFCFLQIREQEARETLLVHEQSFHKIFDEMLNGLAVFDVMFDKEGQPYDARFIEVNTAHEIITGQKREDIIGKTIRQVYPGLEREWFERAGKVAVTGRSERFEAYFSPLKRHFEFRMFSLRRGHFALMVDDVTTRIEVQTALQHRSLELEEERSNLQTIFDSTQVGLLLVDSRMRVKRVNNILLTIVDKTARDVTDKQPGDVLRCIHAEESAEGCGHAAACIVCPIRSMAVKIFASGELSRGLEVRHTARSKSGEIVESWFEVNASPLEIKGARHVLFSLGDITARKRAEEAMRLAKEQAELLMQLVPSAIFTVDLERKITSWNRKMEEITGYSKEETIGKPCTLFSVEPCTQRCGLYSQDVHKPVIGKECSIRTKSGDVRAISKNVDFLRDISGNIIGGIESFDDITEHKRMERELQDSETRHRTMVDNINVGIFRNVVGSDGYFLRANPALVRMFGYNSVEEFLKVKVADLYQDPQERERYIQAFSREGFVKNYELHLKRKDGAPVQGMVTAKAQYDEHGQIQWFDGVIEDVTERKAIEVQLEKYRTHLEELVQARTDQLGRINEQLKSEITERGKVENELQLAKQQLSDIIEFLPDATLVVDSEKRVIAWNRAMEEMTGVRKEDILGKADGTYSLPFYGERRPILIDLVLAPGDLVSKKYPFLERRGDTLFGEAFCPSVHGGKGGFFWGIASKLFNSDGQVFGAIESIREVTERVEAERALDQRLRYEKGLSLFTQELLAGDGKIELALRHLLDAARVSHVFTFENFRDAKDGLCARVVNDVFIQDMNSEAGNPLLQHIPYVSGFMRWRKLLPMNRAVEGVVSSFPESERTILEHLKIKAIVVFPVFVGNEWTGFIGFTDLKQERTWAESEKTLLQTASEILSIYLERQKMMRALSAAKDKAEEANRVKSQFISNVSHEMRTPLNGIIGFAELIETVHSLDRARVMARTITSESAILLRLVNDILDQAKIEAGKIVLDMASCDVSEIVDYAFKTVELQAQAKGLSIGMVVSERVPHFIVADRLRVCQVLINLLNNAVKFTDKGSIKLQVEKVKEGGGTVLLRFSVSDTGLGIPLEKQGLMFKRFVQVDGSTSRRFGGAGLGMAIAKGLVELMGGNIGFESRPGDGTTFWFTLPTQVVDQGVASSVAVEASLSSLEVKEAAVLVVEDYAPNQEVAKIHLEDAGYRVTIAPDGSAAVENCTKNKYQLILMDIQMPGMDGYETTLHLRAMGGWLRDVPILGFTANADDKTLEECLAMGMSGVITKPIRRESFIAQVGRWVRPAGATCFVSSDGQASVAMPVNDLAPAILFDYSRAVQEFGGNRVLLDSLVKSFLVQAQRQVGVLEEAFVRGDAATIGSEAHKIKGAAANLTAERLSRKAKELELKGKSGDLFGADMLLGEFKKELEEFANFVKNGYRDA